MLQLHITRQRIFSYDSDHQKALSSSSGAEETQTPRPRAPRASSLPRVPGCLHCSDLIGALSKRINHILSSISGQGVTPHHVDTDRQMFRPQDQSPVVTVTNGEKLTNDVQIRPRTKSG